MKLLEDRIRKDGIVKEGGVLRVDSFLNHQIDIDLYCEMGKEFYRLFKDSDVTKILTIEASGIGIACITAQYFHVPVVFAKKSKTSNLANDVYSSVVHSFTHGNDSTIVVSKNYIRPGERILVIDDFLANGCAVLGLKDIIEQGGATLVGAGIAVEKSFQNGSDMLKEQGIRVESLARVRSMDPDDGIEFD